MDSFNYNTNLNIGVEMNKIFLIIILKNTLYLYHILFSFILSHRLVLNDGKISYSA